MFNLPRPDNYHWGLVVVIVLMLVYIVYTKEGYYTPEQVESIMRRERSGPFVVKNHKILTDNDYPYKPPRGGHQLVSNQTFDDIQPFNDPIFRIAAPLEEKSPSMREASDKAVDDMISDFAY